MKRGHDFSLPQKTVEVSNKAEILAAVSASNEMFSQPSLSLSLNTDRTVQSQAVGLATNAANERRNQRRKGLPRSVSLKSDKLRPVLVIERERKTTNIAQKKITPRIYLISLKVKTRSIERVNELAFSAALHGPYSTSDIRNENVPW